MLSLSVLLRIGFAIWIVSVPPIAGQSASDKGFLCPAIDPLSGDNRLAP